MIDSLICTGMVLNALYKLFHWTTLSISVSPTHSKVHDTKIFVGLNLFLPLPNLSKTNNMRTLYSSSSDQNDFQLHHPFLPPRSSFSFSYIFFCVLLLMSVMTTRKILKASAGSRSTVHLKNVFLLNNNFWQWLTLWPKSLWSNKIMEELSILLEACGVTPLWG